MSDEARGLRILSLAAHELRTTAGVIGGCLKIASAAGQDAARRDRALDQAARNYERMVELLAEMSDLWRLEAGEAVFNRLPVPVETVLRNAVRHAADRLPDGVGAHLRVEGLDDVRVMGDPVRLERALGAVLLAVARHATASDVPVVAERVDDPREAVRITFGRGAAPRAASPSPLHPLDEFQSGLGLSLPIARRVFEADGGRVWAVGSSDTLQLVVELAMVPRASAS